MKINLFSPQNVSYKATLITNKEQKPDEIKRSQVNYASKLALTGTIVASTIATIALIKNDKTKVIKETNHFKNKMVKNSKKRIKEIISPATKPKALVEKLTDTFNLILSNDNKIEQLSSIQSPKIREVVELIDDQIIKNNKSIDISTYKLDYDPMQPPTNIVQEHSSYKYDIIGEYVPTQNRAEMEELIIPEFIQKEKVEFQIPIKDKIKIKEIKQTKFTPILNQGTNLSESYAESVNWSNDKITRDVLQNFYDGHGQTLDGVKFEIEPNQNLFKKTYKIKISGLGEYSPDKALLLGESTKKDDTAAAGNYGEGLKMSILKILKGSNVSQIKIGSRNWKVTYNLQKTTLNDKRVLGYSLEQVDQIKGNYFEFETNDTELINSFKRAINYFYHSGNTDFKCPHFENDSFGIKKLGEKEKGSIYIAGQRFEFKNNWQGLDGFTLFFKEKPPVGVLDISRDRLSLTEEDLPKLLEYYTFKSSNEEKIKALHSMQEYWDKEGISKQIIKGISQSVHNNYIKINFPENYLSKGFSIISYDLVNGLKSSGYKLCDTSFTLIGMNDVVNYLKRTRNHTPLMPSQVEVKKIGIIKKALAQFPDLYNSKMFNSGELNPKIYIFEANSSKETKLTKDWQAEAIVDYKSKTTTGFWLDKNYLSKTQFTNILGTALHEITHKTGGDGDSAFSYALTDVIDYVLNSMLTNPETVNELRKLNLEWNLINN